MTQCIVCKKNFEPNPQYPDENVCSQDCMDKLMKKVIN